MSVAVVEQIARVIKTRLDTLTVDETAANVYRPLRLDEEVPENTQIVLRQRETLELDTFPGNPPATEKQTTWEVRCQLTSEESDSPIDELRETLVADARKAIVGTGNDWHSFGGYAIDADLAEEQSDSTTSNTGILLVTVRYRHAENDPYTVR